MPGQIEKVSVVFCNIELDRAQKMGFYRIYLGCQIGHELAPSRIAARFEADSSRRVVDALQRKIVFSDDLSEIIERLETNLCGGSHVAVLPSATGIDDSHCSACGAIRKLVGLICCVVAAHQMGFEADGRDC